MRKPFMARAVIAALAIAPAIAAAQVGGAVGTRGSTATATFNPPVSTLNNAGAASTSSAPTETNPRTAGGNVSADAGSSGSSVPSSGSSAAAEPTFVNPEAANAPFRFTPNTPDATPTGAALGQSPGQTSAGTATGASTFGIGAGSENLGTATAGIDSGIGSAGGAGTIDNNPSATTGTGAFASGVVVPGVGVAAGGGASLGGVGGNGARTGGNGATATLTARTPTPVFDMTARQGMARDAQRRARGEEPRIIGIAPRTERDLTHQMPDDPVIRY